MICWRWCRFKNGARSSLPISITSLYSSSNNDVPWTTPKKGFYRSANAIFGKVGRMASEEVVLQLLNSKCIPVLLYGLEACPLLKSDLSSVDFVIVRFLMKLFNTTNVDIINNCRQYFDVKLPSTLWSDRVRRFEKKFAECDNIFLQNFSLNSIAYI